jgi:hypothetical protein
MRVLDAGAEEVLAVHRVGMAVRASAGGAYAVPPPGLRERVAGAGADRCRAAQPQPCRGVFAACHGPCPVPVPAAETDHRPADASGCPCPAGVLLSFRGRVLSGFASWFHLSHSARAAPPGGGWRSWGTSERPLRTNPEFPHRPPWRHREDYGCGGSSIRPAPGPATPRVNDLLRPGAGLSGTPLHMAFRKRTRSATILAPPFLRARGITCWGFGR